MDSMKYLAHCASRTMMTSQTIQTISFSHTTSASPRSDPAVRVYSGWAGRRACQHAAETPAVACLRDTGGVEGIVYIEEHCGPRLDAPVQGGHEPAGDPGER